MLGSCGCGSLPLLYSRVAGFKYPNAYALMHILMHMWWVCGGYVVGIWWVCGGYVVGMWWVFGGYVVSMWWVFGG